MNLRRDAQVAMALVGVVVAMIVAGFVYGNFIEDDEPTASNEPDGVQKFYFVAGDHTNEPVTYAEVPPVGGQHADAWQNCSFYEGAIPFEQAVHSLEHGAVWITFRPDLPQEQVAQLRAIAERNRYVLVSPIAELPSSIVASAWNHQLGFDSPDDPKLNAFIVAFQQGPETPELGAPCSGGSSDLAA